MLAILLSGAHKSFASLLILVYASLVVARGMLMLRGSRGRSGDPSPWRLRVAGVLCLLVSVVAVGAPVSYLGWWPGDRYALYALNEIVARQLARGQASADAEGPRYEPLELDGDQVRFDQRSLGLPSTYGIDSAVTDEGRGFEVWAWPRTFRPLPPYSWFTTVPSFYADETGQIRAIRVHEAGVRCPPDGPVVGHQGASDAPP